MSVNAATYDIEADVYSWWTEEYILQEKEGEGEAKPIDLTGKTVEMLVGGKILKEVSEGEGLYVTKATGKIVAKAYVLPSFRGEYRLNIHVAGEVTPPKAEPFTPIWGSFTPLGPPQ